MELLFNTSLINRDARSTDFCRAMLCKCGLSRHAVSVFLSVRVSVTFVDSVITNKCIFKIFSPSGSHAILVFRTKQHGNILTGTPLTGASNAGGIGRNRDSGEISGYVARCEPVPAASAIHLAATDHGEFITLVTSKRPSLLMAGNNNEVYNKKPQRYVEDNRYAVVNLKPK